MDISLIDPCLWTEVHKHLDPVSVCMLQCSSKQFHFTDTIKENKVKTSSKAAEYGYLEVVKLLTQKPVPSLRIAKYAAANSHLDILRWYISQGGKLYDEVLMFATYKCNKQTYQFLLNNGCEYTPAVFCNIINLCNTELVDFLPELTYRELDDAFRIAIQKGNVKLLTWLYQKGYNVSGAEICSYISRYGIFRNHIEILELIYANGVNFSTYILPCTSIVRNCCTVELLKWCSSHEMPVTQNAIVMAARNGNIDSVKFCLENGCQLTAEVSRDALSAIKLECFYWLVSQGCPIHPDSIQDVLRRGNIEIIEFLLSKGCKLDPDYIHFAYRAGHQHVLEWLETKGYELDYCDLFDTAVSNIQIRILDWLDSKGYRHDYDLIETAVTSNSVNMLKWMFSHGYTSNIDILKTAIDGYCDEITKWWITENKVILTEEEMIKLIENHMFDVVKVAYRLGAVLPDYLVTFAVENSLFSVLRWAVKQAERSGRLSGAKHGCKITQDTSVNDKEISKWISELK